MFEDVTKGMKDKEEVVLPEIDMKGYDIPEYFHLNIDRLSNSDLKSLSFLKEILAKSGINLKVTHYVHNDRECNSIFISHDREKMLEKTTRNAGRKKDYTMKARYKECTVSELKTRLDSGEKKTKIIAELGCPRSTFYRILKNLESLNIEEWLDSSIWIFTN